MYLTLPTTTPLTCRYATVGYKHLRANLHVPTGTYCTSPGTSTVRLESPPGKFRPTAAAVEYLSGVICIRVW